MSSSDSLNMLRDSLKIVDPNKNPSRHSDLSLDLVEREAIVDSTYNMFRGYLEELRKFNTQAIENLRRADDILEDINNPF